MAGQRYGMANLSDDLQWKWYKGAMEVCRTHSRLLTKRERDFVDELYCAEQLSDTRDFGISVRQLSWLRQIAQELKEGKR